MALNDIIKKQIKEQTKQHLNTVVSNVAVNAVDNKQENVISNQTTIAPKWLKGSYILPVVYTPTPTDFLNYSGAIDWEIKDSRIINDSSIPINSLIMYGVQVYSNNSLPFTISVGNNGCAYSVYVSSNQSGAFSSYTKLHSNTDDNVINIPISMNQNVWYSVVFIVRAYSAEAEFAMGADYNNIAAVRTVDIQPPSVPSSFGLNREIVQDNIAKTKITLSWAKDKTIGFAGNGIYKKYNINTGKTVDRSFPATMFGTEGFGLPQGKNESSKWALSFSTGTVNAGDRVSFYQNSSAGVTISSSQVISRNKILNSSFINSDTHWSLSGYTLKQGAEGALSASYLNIATTGTNAQFSAFSTFASITRNSFYSVNIAANQNLLSKYVYGLGGYGSTPSRWAVLGSVSAEATRIQTGSSFVRITRTGVGSGTLRTEDSSFYISANASYYLGVAASLPKPFYYKVNFHLNNDDIVYTTPTLVSGRRVGKQRYITNRITLTPSSSGYGYMSISVPATSGFATMDLSSISLTKKSSANTNLLLKVLYYDSGKSPCATPSDVTILPEGVFNYSAYSLSSAGEFSTPSGCQYVKVGIVASITTTATPVYYYQNVFHIGLTHNEPKPFLSIYATTYHALRAISTLMYSLGSQIFYNRYEHVGDRLRQPGDGDVVYWDDFNIEPSTTYTYLIDAYDSSPFRNRSSRTAEATIFSGDVTPPKAPTSYTCEGLSGGIFHSWANPTANDLSQIICYSDSNLSTIRWVQYTSSTGLSESYSEFVTATTLTNRYLVAKDAWGNVSPSVLATCTPLIEIAVKPEFTVALKSASGDYIVPNENGWYNQNVTASIIVSQNSYPIASYLFSYVLPYFTPSVGWTAFTSFAGQHTWLQNQYKYLVRYQVKDIYGTYSDIITKEINIETDSPSITDDGLWRPTTSGRDRYNLIEWDESKLDGKVSGLDLVVIERAEVTNMLQNPGFEDTRLQGTATLFPLYWAKSSPNVTFWAEPNSGFNDSNTLKTKTQSSAQKYFVSQANSVPIAPGSYLLSAHYKSFPSGSNISNIQIYVDGMSAASRIQRTSESQSSSWQSLSTVFSYTGATVMENVVISITGTANDYVEWDSIIFTPKPTYAAISEILPTTNRFEDSYADAWKYYIYRLRTKSKAGNWSSYSAPVQVRSKADYKDKFRNVLSNSSFEKTTYTTGGTLVPLEWDNWAWNSQFSKTYRNKLEVQSGSGAYHGGKYIRTTTTSDVLTKNDIHVLPYIGNNRNYVVSAYIKNPTATNITTSYIQVRSVNKERTQVRSKTLVSPAATLSGWYRVSATFPVAQASVTYLSLSITSSGTIHYDAVQLEEKQTLPPTEYYDTKSITADYLQGALIRANMIESEQIYANHIKTNTITATQIKANTISATQIKAGSITATQIKTNTITTGELNLQNSVIFIPANDEVRIEASTLTGGPAYGDLCCHIAAVTSEGVIHNVAGRVAQTTYDSTNATICVFTMSNTFSHNSFNYRSAVDKVSATLGRGSTPPLIARTFPYEVGGYGLMVYGKPTSSPNLLQRTHLAFADDYDGFLLANRWSNPTTHFDASGTLIKISPNGIGVADLRYYNDNFYFGQQSWDNINRHRMYKLSQTGTLLTKSIGPLNGDSINDFTFDVSSTGSIVALTAVDNSPTIYLHKYDAASLTRSPGTVEIETFSGSENSVMFDVGYSFRTEVSAVSVVFATQNKYIMTYRMGNSSFVYYKVLSGTGSVYVGGNKDLPLTYYNVSRDDIHTTNLAGMRMARSYFTDPFLYISAIPTLDLAGHSKAGKVVYFSPTPGTINLVELFNRIS